jgi:phosphoglycolate phosphatase-like HAD superfamily hydrolase
VKLLGIQACDVTALVFDMDGTLYENLDYYRFQESSQVERLAGFLGISPSEAAERLGAAREARRAAALPATSMANHFLTLGVDMPSIIRWREEALDPRQWLTADSRLDAALALLAQRFRLALLTNNPRSVGRASLQALGVAARFEQVIGLDDTGKSKPSAEPFIAACRGLGLPFVLRFHRGQAGRGHRACPGVGNGGNPRAGRKGCLRTAGLLWPLDIRPVVGRPLTGPDRRSTTGRRRRS